MMWYDGSSLHYCLLFISFIDLNAYSHIRLVVSLSQIPFYPSIHPSISLPSPLISPPNIHHTLQVLQTVQRESYDNLASQSNEMDADVLCALINDNHR
jgi:hypothetical protein